MLNGTTQLATLAYNNNSHCGIRNDKNTKYKNNFFIQYITDLFIRKICFIIKIYLIICDTLLGQLPFVENDDAYIVKDQSETIFLTKAIFV